MSPTPLDFFFSEPISLGEASYSSQQIIETLSTHLLPERLARLREVVSRRSFSVVSVLENIYDRGNASAILRTAEGLGFLRCHIVESPGARFKEANRVSKGAEKWLATIRHRDVDDCVDRLRTDGYRIFCASLTDARPINELDFRRPLAFVFGNEKEGVSERLQKLADGNVMVPMSGFMQSFNVSVAAALCLYHCRVKLDGMAVPPRPEVEPSPELVLANYLLRSFERPEKMLQAIIN